MGIVEGGSENSTVVKTLLEDPLSVRCSRARLYVLTVVKLCRGQRDIRKRC